MTQGKNRWAIAIAGLAILLMAGMIYAWSVMSKTIAASRPSWSSASLSLTFTLVMVFFCLGSLAAGMLSAKVKSRLFVMAAAVLFAIGFLVASCTGDSPVLLYLGFGALCGFGSGLAYNAVMGTVSAWFPDRQGMISGMMLMGFGLSSFIVGKVFAAMAPSSSGDHWRSVFRLFAVVSLIVLVVTGLLMQRPQPGDLDSLGSGTKKPVKEPAMDVSPAEMIHKLPFWLLYIWAILVSAAGLALMSQASGIASQVGPQIADSTIATVVGLISIVNGVARILYGMLYDRVGFRLPMLLCMVTFVISGVLLIAAITTGQFALVIIGFLFGGFAYGGTTPVQSAFISDFFGRTHYSLNFSLVVTNLLISSFASTIAGKLYDATHSYVSTATLMISVTIAALIAFLFIRRPK